jgi:hypothetical protein
MLELWILDRVLEEDGKVTPSHGGRVIVEEALLD